MSTATTTPRGRRSAAEGGAIAALVLLYLALEYLRPQDLIGAIGVLRLPLLVSVAVALLWLLRGDKSLLSDRLIVLYLGFAGLTALGILYGANQYWPFVILQFLGTYLLAAILPLASFASDPERLSRLLRWWVAINVGVAVLAITSEGRGSGSFLGDENDLALVVVVALPYAYFLAQSNQRRMWGRLAFIGAAIVLTGAAIVSESRGGFLALVAAAGGCLWYSKRRLRAAAILLILALGSIPFLSSNYVEEMQSITDPTDSTREARLYSWRLGWKMFKDNPVFGVGAGNYPWRVQEYEIRSNEWNPGDKLHGGRVAHSLYFTLLPEYGLVGTAIYLLILVIMIQRYIRLNRRFKALGAPYDEGDLAMLSRAAGPALLGFLVGATFISVLYYPMFWLLIGFLLALERALERLPVADIPDNVGPSPRHHRSNARRRKSP